MSRIGNKEIIVPANVQVEIGADNLVKVTGPKGTLTRKFQNVVKFEKDGDKIVTKRVDDGKESKCSHGLSRTLLNNMIEGVTNGYKKVLVINGVGFKAAKQGSKLVLNIGFSHPVEIMDTEDVKTNVLSATEIEISGINKEVVGQFAAQIRDIKRCEPYHGYGIRYNDEVILRKEGSKTAGKK